MGRGRIVSGRHVTDAQFEQMAARAIAMGDSAERLEGVRARRKADRAAGVEVLSAVQRALREAVKSAPDTYAWPLIDALRRLESEAKAALGMDLEEAISEE